jgi:myo-inositol-1(or 4)-monophosphatase
MHPLLNIAISAARNASKHILKFAERIDTVQVIEKKRHDFVSEVDQIAEREIINTIHKAYPDHAILAEESGHAPNDNSQYTWIIDPLDGTTNYLHGFPFYAVSIAIQHKNRIEHGVIYDPVRQELFTASRGAGAQLNNHRIRVSKRSQLEGALLGTGFPFKNIEKLPIYLKSFEALTLQASGVRRAGAAALDLAYVAAGRLDGFWELGLSPWDLAAGALMISEAGGLISDFTGAENYLESGNVVTGNPKVFKQMLQIIQPILA